MKVPGYCEKCRRIKQVQVTGAALASGGVVSGVCDACAQESDRRIEARRPKVGMRFFHRRQITRDRQPVEMVISALRGRSVYYKPVDHKGAGFVSDISRFYEEVGRWS